MNKKNLKKLMTDVAKGSISMKEAENQFKPKKKLKLNKKGGNT